MPKLNVYVRFELEVDNLDDEDAIRAHVGDFITALHGEMLGEEGWEHVNAIQLQAHKPGELIG